MFASQGLFKGVQCPGGLDCRLPNCIFAHKEPAQRSVVAQPKGDAEADAGGDRKRIKLSHGLEMAASAPAPAAKSTPVERPEATRSPFVGLLRKAPEAITNSPASLSSLDRAITPPLKANGSQSTTSAKTSSGLWTNFSIPHDQKEDLNPRLVGNGNNCAPHNTRLSLLRILHAQMARLDGETLADADEMTRKRGVHPLNLVQLALDEEQRIVKAAGPNYRVTMGHTLVKYKNMKVKDWMAFLDSNTAPPEAPKPSNPFSTELGPELERLLLSRYIVNTDGLDKYGYVLVPPTDEAIANTRIAVEKSDNWEACDRCGTRFQIFPNRRDDGALTSGSICRHHWGRAYRNKDTKERMYNCCGVVVGQPGCTTHDTHVFKTSDATRLASHMQFVQTPANLRISPCAAVSFDCEMGYTTLGMEMIRVSAVAWPSNERLIDSLVRPKGHILDLNTRFSGVTSDQFLNAVDYTPPLDGTFTHADIARSIGHDKEPILPTPEIARALLFSFIAPSTPLIGHSIDNDLNVMRIIHPAIVDTVIMYPFPQGLPYRYGLKKLTAEHLLRDIQTAGADGHDSMEDARATGDLVRAKLAKEWVLLKSMGWRIDETASEAAAQDRKRVLVPPENWVEKGAGKAYLMPGEMWWQSDVVAGAGSVGANAAGNGVLAAVRKRISSAASPLVRKKV